MNIINFKLMPFIEKTKIYNVQNSDKSKSLMLNSQLNFDTVSFTRRQKPLHTIDYDTETITQYKNVLEKTLKSTPNIDFEKKLKQVDHLYSFEKSKERISSLSRYLKEDMIGFIVPKYKLDSKPYGGYQWFEKSMEFLIKGCKSGVKPEEYSKIAKEFFGLLALHDNYWKSNDFIKYLYTLDQNEFIQAAIQGVKELIKEKDNEISFTAHGQILTRSYFSPLKFIPKLLNDGCAYTNVKLVQNFNISSHESNTSRQHLTSKIPSMEHIMPKSWGGPCDDSNYILTSQESNTKRGNMSLLKYLKGCDDL